MHEIGFIKKYKELFAKHTIKTRLGNYGPTKNMETIFINMWNNKTNEYHKFVLNSSQKLDLRSSN